MNNVLPKSISLDQVSPIQQVCLPHWSQNAPSVWVKRDDLLHSIVSGNKWRKLKYQRIEQHSHIVSLGGGYSNHLHALGYLCQQLNTQLTAIIRGHYQHSLTPMLQDLSNWGCELVFIDKKHYKERDTPEFLSWVHNRYPTALFIPEGGSTQDALKGVQDVIIEVEEQCEQVPTHYISPVASGATLAGLISASNQRTQSVIGVAVLNGEEYLEQQVSRFLTHPMSNWHIVHNYVHGGYAKQSDELNAFIDNFISATGIPIEPVYSAKLFFALDRMIMNKIFNASDRLCVLHTGGLQGAR